MKLKSLAACLALAIASAGLQAQMLVFESDFLGTSSEVYDDDTIRLLVEGWTGQRDPLGDHGGVPPHSDVSGSVLQYQGGQGNSSDSLLIRRSVSGIPSSYSIHIRFRRDGGHSNSRTDFIFSVDSTAYIVGSGAGNATGINGGPTAPFPLVTGVWYMMEIIHDGSNLVEMRVWEDSGMRPSTPLVTTALTASPPALLQFTGGNFTSPEASVDWIRIYNPPMPVELQSFSVE